MTLSQRDHKRRKFVGRHDPEDAVAPRPCQWPDCGEAAEYRAPSSPHSLREFVWFCLDHVREYNRNWDYFRGLDANEIERIRRQDTVWHRPSWPLGPEDLARVRTTKDGEPVFDDVHGVFGTRFRAPPPPRQTPRDIALAEFGLDRNATRGDIKARYKELAKRHHPDANGGCKKAEERLKVINEAYTYLLTCDAP